MRGRDCLPFVCPWVHLRVLLGPLVFYGFFCLFVFVLCFVYQVLSVSLDCPFLIAPSVFSDVYFIYNTIVYRSFLFLHISTSHIHVYITVYKQTVK